MRERGDRRIQIAKARLDLGERGLGQRLIDGVGLVIFDRLPGLGQSLLFFSQPRIGKGRIMGIPFDSGATTVSGVGLIA